MEFTIELPADFEPMDLRTLLEQEWLVPRKVRHFLRTRKNVMVNQQPKLWHETVYPNDLITLTFEESDYQKPHILLGKKAMIQPLYEDEHLIIVDKPAGMKTHPNQPDERDTLLNHLAAYLAPKEQIPYVVHRLDKETSGAILFAKNPFVLPILSRMLEKKWIHRHYQAVIAGDLKQKTLTIQKKIGRDRHDRRKRIIDEKKGQLAITHITRQTHSAKESQILCQLETGRTHQIRVHLKSIGHPILGDPLYHPNPQNAKRLMLHAYQMEFVHPFTQKKLTVQTHSFLFSIKK